MGQGSAAGGPRKPKPEDFRIPAGAVVPRRKLGRTGVEVSLVGLGGFHIGQAKDQETATRVIRTAIDHGVTFLDNCWDYNQGRSHEWMGQALRDGYRAKAFLMSKIDGRTRAAAAAQIDQSLRQLQTDVIDLMQIHEVIYPDDPARCFARDGAVEALVAARKAGKIRFIGFTGHKKPAYHLAMLAEARKHDFHFDTIQMPINVMDAHHDSFAAKVLPVALREQVAVLAMKPLGGGVFLEQSQALGKGAVSVSDCLQYPMSLPTSVVITGCEDLGTLMQAIDAAVRFASAEASSGRAKQKPADRKALLARTAGEGRSGQLEKYKTSDQFDGTAKHPWWLETASVKKPG